MFLFPVLATAVGALEAFGHDLFQGRLIPVVAARGVLGEAVGHLVHPFGVVPGFAAVLAEQGHDGHAPLTLARDAPVGTGLDHVVDAVAAPGGDPLHLGVDGVEGLLAQVVLFHADEPLGGGTEDDRLLAAPAVRVGVADLGGLEQCAHFGQLFDDLGVGFKDVETGEKFHGRQEAARIVQGRVNVQLVGQAHFVVLAAVAGSGVDAAGTGIQGHVAAQDQGGLAVIEGMAGDEAFQFLTGGAAHHGHAFPAEGLGAAFQQLFGQLHTGIGHVDADDRMAHGSQSRGHAQAEFSQTDDADFQSFLCHAGSLSRWRRCPPAGRRREQPRTRSLPCPFKTIFLRFSPRAAGFPRRRRPFWAAGCAGPAAGRAAPPGRRTC